MTTSMLNPFTPALREWVTQINTGEQTIECPWCCKSSVSRAADTHPTDKYSRLNVVQISQRYGHPRPFHRLQQNGLLKGPEDYMLMRLTTPPPYRKSLTSQRFQTLQKHPRLKDPIVMSDP